MTGQLNDTFHGSPEKNLQNLQNPHLIKKQAVSCVFCMGNEGFAGFAGFEKPKPTQNPHPKNSKKVTKKIHQINPIQVRKKTLPPGRHHDGRGLYLHVLDSGAATWSYRYTMDKKPREMGLGSVELVTLAEAREMAHAARKLAWQGIDPIEARKADRAPKRATGMTFAQAAAELIELKRAGWRAPKHAEQWRTTLSRYAEPVIGALDVTEVNTAHIRQILDPIWIEKTETASRLRGRIEAVLDYAKAHGHRTGDNPAAWRGHLDKIYPAQSTIEGNNGHFAALNRAELPDFYKRLVQQDGLAAFAARLIILTAVRTSEALEARWAEFDLLGRLWVIPAPRTKRNREHRVPLAPQVVEMLQAMPTYNNTHELVFPGRDIHRPLSNMACLVLLGRMGVRGQITMHGFRSTFKDWAREDTSHDRDVIEAALAHVIKDKTEGAYARGDVLEKRRRLMQDWANLVTGTNTHDDDTAGNEGANPTGTDESLS